MVLSETFSVIIILTSKGVIYSNAKRYTALKSLWLLRLLGGQAGFSPGQGLRLLSRADSVYNKGSQSFSYWCLSGVEVGGTHFLFYGRLFSVGLQTSFWADVTNHILIYQCFQLFRNRSGQSVLKMTESLDFSPQGFNNLNFLRKILRD